MTHNTHWCNHWILTIFLFAQVHLVEGWLLPFALFNYDAISWKRSYTWWSVMLNFLLTSSMQKTNLTWGYSNIFFSQQREPLEQLLDTLERVSDLAGTVLKAYKTPTEEQYTSIFGNIFQYFKNKLWKILITANIVWLRKINHIYSSRVKFLNWWRIVLLFAQ